MEGRLLDGRYRLTARLATGGMGEVWRSHDERIGREVAVKIVTAARLTPDALARFDREARIAGNLSGPGIVTVHDYGHSDYAGETVPYLVMELLSGRTLAETVRAATNPPPLEKALRWTAEVCQALEIAHRTGIVHRDIKPSNVMVTADGAVKVLDFGIARFVEDEQVRGGLTVTGMIVGSAEYMSPEQAEGRKVDYRTDLYGLGCLLYFLTTTRPPFEGESFMGLAYQHTTKIPDPPSTTRPGLPPELDALVLELLAKAPADRPASAAAVRERVLTILAGLGGAPAAAPVAPPVPGPAAPAAPAGNGAASQPPSTSAAPAGAASGPAVASAPVDKGTATSATQLSSTSVSQAAPQPSPAQAVTPPATGVWSAPQEVRTEVRHYPGDQQAPPPGFRPGTPPPPHQQPPYLPPGPGSPAKSPNRRWVLGTAAAVSVGGAAGIWLALSGSKDTNGARTGASVPGPSATTAPSGSSSTKATTTPSTTPSTTTTSAAAAGPHNPTFVKTLSGHTGDIVSVAFTPDNQVLASGSFDGTARLWNVADPAKATALGVCPSSGKIWNIAISPDGRTLATASDDKTARLWNIADPANPVQLSQVTLGNRVIAVAFSPDGQILATGDADNTVQLFDLGNPLKPANLAKLTGHSGLIYSVAFHPTAKILASGSFDSTVRLWDYSTPTSTKTAGTLAGHTSWVFDIAFRPDGHVLAAASRDHSCLLWDTTDTAKPRLVGTCGEPDEVTGVAFSPDGKTLATGCGSSAQVRLWDVTVPSSPHALAPLTGHTAYTYGMAFSPDARLLASGGGDHTVRLWKF